jgi:hypothetical protein
MKAGKLDDLSAAFSAADRAVESAVGRLGLVDPTRGDAQLIEPLLEIVQLHVRQQLSAPK